jgi:hypothetical protein
VKHIIMFRMIINRFERLSTFYLSEEKGKQGHLEVIGRGEIAETDVDSQRYKPRALAAAR